MQARTQEEALVLKAQAGDERAFAVLYRAYQPSLVKFAFRMLRNEAAAFDAVQEAWLMVARTLGKLHHPGMFRARIFKAVRWRALDQLRKRPNEPLSFEEDGVVEPAASVGAMDGRVTRHQLRTLITSLPDVEQQAIYLFYLEDMKLEEISAVLDVPVGTVKSRLNRARGRLQAQVRAEEGELA
ncbi:MULTISPECIES: RNA polymerase sigma factor [Kordiimonas]|uniref:RNA polymerase sigma factor n=1 Tax=Kordiimonas TaxID=288021 RepID=UPI002580970E|nr:sigma-70 family RNA polymerase sigma factor [Kordiimonas sp. UBA4487]